MQMATSLIVNMRMQQDLRTWLHLTAFTLLINLNDSIDKIVAYWEEGYEFRWQLWYRNALHTTNVRCPPHDQIVLLIAISFIAWLIRKNRRTFYCQDPRSIYVLWQC